MDVRLDLFENTVATKIAKHSNSAGPVIAESTLPAATQELVKLRASQIKGSGFCTGAAFELTEQGTRVADAAGGVTDQAWANAGQHYDEDQLGELVSLIALIDTYDRRPGALRP
jgi:alkylhydroperoxidase family enzyme